MDSITAQTHLFVDASILGYAAVIYARSHQHDQIQTNIILSKQRLMPIKRLTITKAKLMAALIGARALTFVRQELAIPLSHCFAWSDSKCVLSWLATKKLDALPRFVKNRVSEIQKHKYYFRYVPSESNPADIATRGLTPAALTQSQLWWHGPNWIGKNESQWPLHSDTLSTSITTGAGLKTVHTHGSINDYTITKSWERLCRIVEKIITFFQTFHRKYTALPSSEATQHDRRTWIKTFLLSQAQKDLTEAEIKQWGLVKDEKG